MPKPILHQYAASPFSEKVRLLFGLKKMDWQAVEIPTIMPKPLLMPLTGGYRKTPVMQIGADIYCDTQIIVRVLEEMKPAPSLYPNGDTGLAKALGFWADKAWFQTTVPIIFGEIAPLVPEEFFRDREKLSPGRSFSVEEMKAATPFLLANWQAQANWVDEQLSDGRQFLTGAQAGLADAQAYYIVWFLNSALPHRAEELLAPFPNLRAWFDRLVKVGHGQKDDISGEAALSIAKDNTPQPIEPDEVQSSDFLPGQPVLVNADDYGTDTIEGDLLRLTPAQISIARKTDETGAVHVHFPRAGFNVRPVS